MKSRSLDQFYTKGHVAKECIAKALQYIPDIEDIIFLEPSAGTGSFLLQLPKPRIGLDIDPHHPEIIRMDYLNYAHKKSTICVIGNPPFGKNSSTALKFINKSADIHAELIAFILPRTFKKASMINKINKRYHLIHEHPIGENAFIHNNEPYSVPCVFQIWERQDTERAHIDTTVAPVDYIFTDKNNADFAIQRVGVNAGKVKDVTGVSPSSHYFIRTAQDVRYIFERLYETESYTEYKYNTAGNPSISKYELCLVYDAERNKHVSP